MTTLLTAFLSILFFPITLILGWVIVHPQEEKIILSWGKFAKILNKPGLSFISPWGRKIIKRIKIIAEGAVEIVDEAVTMLDGRGYKLDERTRSNLVSSLLVVICGEGKVQPTYSVQDGGGDSSEASAAMLVTLEKIAKHTTPR